MLIVFNPAAGGRRRRRLARALRALGLQGLRPEVAETARPGHAAELAREAAGRGVGMVVAAGGDGAAAGVASGLAGFAALLGIPPFGTANVLAWELGLPPRPEGAARVLAAGRAAVPRPGLARFGGGSSRLFVQMAGAGFDAAVVANLDLPSKRRAGKAAYVAQAARELFRYPFPRFAIALDGAGPEAVASAIVAKGRFYAGRHLLAPGAAPPLGLLPRLPGVGIRRASRVRLLGDPAGAPPLEVEDAPGPLRVVLPRAAPETGPRAAPPRGDFFSPDRCRAAWKPPPGRTRANSSTRSLYS